MGYDIPKIIKPTITVDTAIYAAADVLGAPVVSGVITLTGAMRKNGGSGLLHSITVFDDDNEKGQISFLFFSAVTGGTYVGNGALALSAADKAALLGKVDVVTADYATFGGDAYASVKGINLPVAAASTTNDLYVIPCITTGTPTYTATTDLKLTFGFIQN